MYVVVNGMNESSGSSLESRRRNEQNLQNILLQP